MSRVVVARLSRVVFARRPFARLAALSSIGVTAAYALGSSLPHVNAQVAAITALVAARPTFHASVQEGLRQTLGLLLGAAFALLIITTVGIGVPALLVGMLGCWATARRAPRRSLSPSSSSSARRSTPTPSRPGSWAWASAP
jgi:uncharacterized membrane protein YccC